MLLILYKLISEEIQVKMKVKKKFKRFWIDGNAVEVLICVIVACIILVGIYVFINYLFPDGENYLKLTVAGIFSLGGICISTIFAHKEKNKEAVLKYVTEKRLSWVDDTRITTADLCSEVFKYIDILPNTIINDHDLKNINISTTDLLLEGIDISTYEIEKLKKQLNISYVLYPSKDSVMTELRKRVEKYHEQQTSEKAYYKFSNKFTLLYLKYNLKGERDKIILQILKELYNSMQELDRNLTMLRFKATNDTDLNALYECKKNIIIDLRLLVQHTQIYLKLEWERIKNESVYDGSIKHRRKKIKKKMLNDRLELYEEQKRFDKEPNNRFKLYIEPTYNRFKKQIIRSLIR